MNAGKLCQIINRMTLTDMKATIKCTCDFNIFKKLKLPEGSHMKGRQL